MREDRSRAFTEDGGKLGGAVSPAADELVMLVQADERLYLSGSVRDTYTGTAWKTGRETHTAIERNDDGFFETGEYPAELDRQQRYYMRFYGRAARNVTIDMIALRTRSVFTPPYRTELWLPQEAELRQSSLGTISARRSFDMYTRYTQFYIDWDYRSPYFMDILRSQAASAVDADAVKAEMTPYLQLPEGLPRRVSALAEELTEGYGNDYDRLAALEAYLRKFPYTLTPPETPAGSDFVDYFLFGAQEGYCVYYASAMAVMARSIGIPTRYVEGFALPPEENSQGRYEVTGAQAHAWVEAFFPGFGWVQFEPTGGQYAGNNTGGELPGREPAPEPESPVPETPPVPPAIPGREPEPEPEEPDMPGREPQPAPAITGEDQEGAGSRSAVVSLTVAAVVLAAAAFLLRRKVQRGKSRRRRLETLPERQRSVAYFGRLLGAMGALGYPMLGQETAHAYAERLAGTVSLRNGSLAEAADIFARASYSRLPVTEQEASLIKHCYQELLGRLRGMRWGKLRLYWRHTVLDRI
jgi:transglutaminase-like putative cysteine protease